MVDGGGVRKLLFLPETEKVAHGQKLNVIETVW